MDNKNVFEEEKVRLCNKNELSCEEVYTIIQQTVMKQLEHRELLAGKKKLYYISAEFLLGKMLNSNLINLGLWEDAKAFALKNGCTWEQVQNVEKEPSLGNGGLGRLAACFLDSIASLQLPGDGIGLYYHFGLFEQKFEKQKQREVPNTWIDEKHSWFRKSDVAFDVSFPGLTLHPVCYDMDVIGYHGNKNTLHLFDIESVDESIVKDGISFDKKDIAKNLTLFLYPDDSDEDGRLLRIYQQYFMVSCGAQMILEDCKKKGYDLHKLDEHVVIQINDTHPTLVIPELIRLLMEEGIRMRDAMRIVSHTCAYTNHTILAEALETWPKKYLQNVVPHLMGIMEALDAVVKERNEDERVAIIDENDRVHMAHIDIHFTKSVNGVAAIHTEILKNTELHDFYRMYPKHFNNKTNGITFRRWLYSANPQLTDFLKDQIGEEFLENADRLSRLLEKKEDPKALEKLLEIKKEKKLEWCLHMKQKQGVSIDPSSIFDTQVKRLHEYKRQQMNALYLIYKILEIRKGNLPKRPITCIFGAKAAPAYTIAKDIIHVLLCLEKIVREDTKLSPYLQICFIENYNVSEAELVIPATDISEQISLASKEASGTGNMKFMLNGAVTLGTRDGANVEIADLVKKDNIYVFGEDSDAVIAHYEKHDYCSRAYYDNNKHIHELIDYLVSDEMLKVGDEVSLRRFYNELLNKDWFMTLLDLESYIQCKEQMLDDYEDRMNWAKKMLVNIAMSGFFSSDRTIKEYEHDIWKLSEGGI